MSIAVVSLSGGMDSAVLASYLQMYYDEVHALTFDYGQTHRVEVEAARDVARHLELDAWVSIVLPHDLLSGFGSALIEQDGVEMPEMTYAEIEAHKGPSPTYVPFRNGLFISYAAAYALTNGAEVVALATHAEDARNWAYPDCTPEFNGAMANALYTGTYHQVRLQTPFQWMKKSEIVTIGDQIGVPFDLTISCYRGSPPCNTCPTCVARKVAFEDAGVVDPLTGVI